MARGVSADEVPAARPRSLPLRLLLRLLLAAALTAGLLLIACSALLVTSAPPLVSLLVEPFSILLAPGLLASVVGHRRREMSPTQMVAWCGAFYLLLSFGLLTWLNHRRSVAARG